MNGNYFFLSGSLKCILYYGRDLSYLTDWSDITQRERVRERERERERGDVYK